MADAAPPDAPEEEADPVLRSAMAKLEQAALRYDSVRDKQSLRAFDGASMNAASFQQQLQRAFPSLRLSEPEAYALLACFDNDGGGTIDGAEFMKTFFSRSFAIKADGDRAARDAKAARAAKEVRKREAAARAKRKAMDARYDANFSDEDMLVARRRICAAAEHYDADNTDAMPLTGFQGAEMHPAVFEDQLKRCFHVTFTPKQLGAVVSIFDASGDGFVDGAEFLRTFFQLGFDQRRRTRHLEEVRASNYRDRERRAAERRSATRRAKTACGAVWKSNLQLDCNVSVFECSDTSTSAVLRELDESHRFVQKSAESTSM